MREKGGEKAGRERGDAENDEKEIQERERERKREGGGGAQVDKREREGNGGRERALKVDNPGSPSEYLCFLRLAGGKFIIRFS